MPYDPKTGEYTEENTSVSGRMTDLLNKDNDYMKQAETAGLKSANRRGLLNSSIAVGSAQESRVKAALPIASQEASQAFQGNQNSRQLQVSDIQQQRGITSQEGMQGRDIASREGMQGRDIASREGMQGLDIASREGMQGRDITSREGMQQRDLASREGMQQVDIEAQQSRLAQELGSREALQAAEILARREMQGEELSSRERLQLQELQAAQARVDQQLEVEQTLAGLDRELRERLQSMDLAAGDLRSAATLAQGYENAYSNTIAGIMANTEIPAAERQQYMNHAATIRDSNISLLEQFFNIELEWGSSGGSTTTPYTTDPDINPRDNLVDNLAGKYIPGPYG